MESLDLGPQPASPRRRRLQVIVAAVVIVGLMIAVGIHNLVSRSSSSAPNGSAPPTPTSRSTSTPSATRPLPTPSGTADAAGDSVVQQWRTDGFLSDVDLDLFARSDQYVYRIQTKKKLVTATKTPTSQSSGALTFVVDRRQVIVRDLGNLSPGYVVPDGKPPRPLPRALTRADQIFAGPPGRLWVTARRDDGTSTTRLTDLRGRSVRTARGVTQFRNVDALMSDGFGGLLAASAGGYYELTPQGPRRLTRGVVLATGRTQLLTVDCNSNLECSSYLLNRDTGRQRRLGAVAANMDGGGVVSDDGRYAALWSWGDSNSWNLRVLDLQTHTTLGKVSDPERFSDYDSLLWLPDNRLVGIQGGKLFVFSPKTGKFDTPKLRIDGLQQLSHRRSS